MENCDFQTARSSDVVLLVMGITGSGKSSFISTIMEEDVGNIIGHRLTSHTSGVDFFPLQKEDGRRVFLVDTPGFDDTNRSNAEVLKEIAFVLAQIYRQKLSVAGIIYTHRVTDNRVSGSSMKNLEILQRLCGPNAFSRVTLTTTMWDSVRQNTALLQDAYKRETQLRNTQSFWGALISGGAHIARWTGEKQSTLEIISRLTNLYDQNGSIVLKIQKELVDDEMSLHNTDAGAAVGDGYTQALAKQQSDLQDISAQFRRALMQSNKDMTDKLRNQLNTTREELESIEASQSAMRTTIKRLTEEKTEKYRRLLEEIQEEHRSMIKSMTQYQADYQRSVDEERANIKAHQEAQRESERQRARIKARREAQRLRELKKASIKAQREAERESEFERLSIHSKPPSIPWSSSSSTVDADELSKLDEFDAEFQQQFDEEQSLLKDRKTALDKKMRRERRKILVKQNAAPMLSILAGVGATVGGGLLINPGLIIAGAGLVVNGVSKLRFSRKEGKRENGDNEEDGGLFGTESLVSLSSSVE